VDLNADLGESYGPWRLGDDEALLDIVTSANIACGFHGGDPATLVRTCAAAVARGVTIGAHVSYPDRVGFGRRAMEIALDDLYADVLYQLGALDGIARAAGVRVAYVKPHGALYNRVVHDEAQAAAVVRALAAWSGPDSPEPLAVLGMPGSALLRAAAGAGLVVVSEGYADRAYRSDGSLMPRSRPGAVLHEPDAVARRALRMARDGVVEADDGALVPLAVDSICLHGDTPDAVATAAAVRRVLADGGVALAPFTPRAVPPR
jgi:UPF0271 protein